MTKLRNYDGAPGCSVEAALHIMGGKWKGVILYHLLLDGTHRFNELQRRLTGVPPRLLIKQLRDLEEDGLVVRTVYAVVPPKVEYALSDEGRSLEPFLLGLCTWGDAWLARRGMTTAAQMKLDAEAEAELTDASAHDNSVRASTPLGVASDISE